MNEKILELIENGKYSEVRREIISLNVADIALLFEEIESSRLLVIFRILPKEIAAGVFTHLSYELQRYIIESIADKEVGNIIEQLYLDDTIDFIEEMPANVVKRVLANTDPQTRKHINQILNYPDNTAGSMMTIEYVDLKKDMTVSQAIQRIKETGIDKETIDTCYVIDSNRVLEGVISIRRLILSPESAVIEDIMHKGVIFSNTHDDQEELAALFRKYDYLVIPVTDNERRLVGIVTIDDILDVIEQENTEDLQKMAAMHPSEKEYLKTSPFGLAKMRITWLLVLMISASLTGSIIRHYDKALQSVLVLASFIPMLMNTGGNAGSQSSTLIIRGLALGEIKLRDIGKVVLKELQVSILVGIALATVNFARVYFIEGVDLLVALTVNATMFCTVILAKMVGSTLPILAKSVKIDPAIMASPMITTIVDGVTLLIYFTMASLLLGV